MFADAATLFEASRFDTFPDAGTLSHLRGPARSLRQAGASRQVTNPKPYWEGLLLRNFAALASLRAGWDGPRSRPIAQGLIYKADRLIRDALDGMPNAKAPNVVPSADGSLQIEWHTANFEFEFTLGIDGHYSAWLHNRETGAEIEGDDSEALDLLLRRARQVATNARDENNEMDASRSGSGLRAPCSLII